MPHIRGRDARAILFCAGASLVVAVVSYVMMRSLLISAALVAALLAWLLTRPRMRRVIRRLRGETVGWSSYYRD